MTHNCQYILGVLQHNILFPVCSQTNFNYSRLTQCHMAVFGFHSNRAQPIRPSYLTKLNAGFTIKSSTLMAFFLSSFQLECSCKQCHIFFKAIQCTTSSCYSLQFISHHISYNIMWFITSHHITSHHIISYHNDDAMTWNCFHHYKNYWNSILLALCEGNPLTKGQ